MIRNVICFFTFLCLLTVEIFLSPTLLLVLTTSYFQEITSQGSSDAPEATPLTMHFPSCNSSSRCERAGDKQQFEVPAKKKKQKTLIEQQKRRLYCTPQIQCAANKKLQHQQKKKKKYTLVIHRQAATEEEILVLQEVRSGNVFQTNLGKDSGTQKSCHFQSSK